MSNYNSNRPLAVTELKDKGILWNEPLQLSSRFIICPIAVNLLTFRKNLKASGTSPTALNEFLNDHFYLSESASNPGNLSISELFEIGADVEAIFDPLNISNITWSRLSSCAQRQDLPENKIKLNQIEAKLVLCSNHEKQRQLAVSLKEKEKTYAKDWIVFSRRMVDFWSAAFTVCLKDTDAITSEVLLQNLPNDLYEWVFLSNRNNCWAYLVHISRVLEEEYKITQTMEQIKLVLKSMEDVVRQCSRQKSLRDMVDGAFMEAASLINKLWSSFWETKASKAPLDTPLTRDLNKEAQSFDILLQKLADTDLLFGEAGADYIKSYWESAERLITKWNELTAYRGKLTVTHAPNDPLPGSVGQLSSDTLHAINETLRKLQAYIPDGLLTEHENT